jgi:hypothetical protein
MIPNNPKLPPIPAGNFSVITVSGGKYADGTLCIIVSIGRPTMEETEAGEMVASHVMRVSTAMEIIKDLQGTIAKLGRQ